jgi:hypothetical protein
MSNVRLNITLELDRFHLVGRLPDDPQRSERIANGVRFGSQTESGFLPGGDYDFPAIRAALADIVDQLAIDCREGPAWTAETDTPAGSWYLSAGHAQDVTSG